MDQSAIQGKQFWLIGAGHMGSAILSGLPDDMFHRNQWVVIDHHSPYLERWKNIGKTITCNTPDQVPSLLVPDYVILAVKPQDLTNVLTGVASHFSEKTVLVSVAAGKTIASIAACVSHPVGVIRTMPNLAALIGEGVTVACANSHISSAQKDVVHQILQAIGDVHWVEDETLLNAVTALSGSGPAYVYYFTECLIEAGQKLGLSAELAKHLAVATVKGSANLPVKTNQDVKDLRVQVTSPKGTTEAALTVFMKDKALSSLVEEAMRAAAKRAQELAG